MVCDKYVGFRKFEFGASIIFEFGASIIFEFGTSIIFEFGASIIFEFGASIILEFGASIIFEFGASITVPFVGKLFIFLQKSEKFFSFPFLFGKDNSSMLCVSFTAFLKIICIFDLVE